MVASMTGFGKGDAESNGYRAEVEIRSVNGRHGEVFLHLPRALTEVGSRIKEIVLATLSRGRVETSLTLEGKGAEQGLPVLNEAVLAAYLEGLNVLRGRVASTREIDPTALAMLPDMFGFEADAPDIEALWPAVETACQAAVAQCQAMRCAEGEKLAQDLVQRVQALEHLLGQVEERAPARVEEVRQRLEEKLARMLTPEQVDQNRVLMEIAVLAERSDITEECVRFHSHNAQFLKALEMDEPVGRRLNFLLQEMLREANTIGSKAGDSEIAHLIVEAKEELEKIREQVQNIE